MIESIVHCLLNITILNDRFNGNIITDDKIFSNKFQNIIIQKRYKNNLLNCSDLIDLIKSLFYDTYNLI